MSRKFFVGGNWKMNGSMDLVRSISATVNKVVAENGISKLDIVVAPPSPYLSVVRQAVDKSIGVAAQNIYPKDSGAYTGEISVAMLRELGVNFVILGHSERRELFKESDSFVGEKVAKALEDPKNGLSVIACIGEKLEERESNQTFDVLKRQMSAIVESIDKLAKATSTPLTELWSKVVIAYEPVWAIGTGKVATPAQAQEVHAFLRKWLAQQSAGDEVASAVRIIYGGSVNSGNCGELAKLPDVDGFLVGGASLKPEFSTICEASKI